MTDLLTRTLSRIGPPDETAAVATQRLLDAKTKPVGSLGRLETVATRIAAVRRGVPATAPAPAIVVAAADHGVAVEGVSAYPREVTGQMVANFATGGAAVCVLARAARARLLVVDAGVLDPPALEGVRSCADGVRGTRNSAVGPAMERSTAIDRVEAGIALANELADDGVDVIAIGDMGIGNTTAASALCSALLPADPSAVCGRGTGLDDEGLARKIDVVRMALAANGLVDGHPSADPLGVLAAVGGLEIAFLAGVILGGAARWTPVVLDGFVTGAAALVAAGLAPDATGSMIAATRSPEPGHPPVLERLSLEPLLDLGIRLGEGSGAALALPLLHAAVEIVTTMATFETAGVSRG